MKQKRFNNSAPRNEYKPKNATVRNLDANILSKPVHEVGLARLSEVVKTYCMGRSTGRVTKLNETSLNAEFVIDMGNSGVYKFQSSFPISVIKDKKVVGDPLFIDTVKGLIS